MLLPSSTEVKYAYANSISPKKADRTRYRYAARKGVREFGFGLKMDPSACGKLGGSVERHLLPNSRHSRVILAPADSPSEEQFTLGNVATELELEPRRANLLGAFDDAVDGPDDEADGQDEPFDAADGAAVGQASRSPLTHHSVIGRILPDVP